MVFVIKLDNSSNNIGLAIFGKEFGRQFRPLDETHIEHGGRIGTLMQEHGGRIKISNLENVFGFLANGTNVIFAFGSFLLR